MHYIKQLDSLRGIAIFLVLVGHWLPSGSVINITPNGFIGVNMFFVLSGFLITRILFINRIDAELLHTAKQSVVKLFYCRRALRIFPAYYLYVLVLLTCSRSLNIDPTAFIYLVTYSTNYYIMNIGFWPEYFGHLWSLAVEEQFYLIWPWVILFVNKKYYFHFILIFILIGILSQILIANFKMNNILTFTCFDAFGLGALLSWQTAFKADKLRLFYVRIRVAAIIAALLFLWGLKNNQWPYIPARTLISVVTLWLISYVVLNQTDKRFVFKFILNNSVLIWLGKISYGLYLYHNIIPELLNRRFINKYLNPLLPDILFKKYWGLLFVFENAILLILVSCLSYILIEKKFLDLKKHFEPLPLL